jgi:hypothetical protein
MTSYKSTLDGGNQTGNLPLGDIKRLNKMLESTTTIIRGKKTIFVVFTSYFQTDGRVEQLLFVPSFFDRFD